MQKRRKASKLAAKELTSMGPFARELARRHEGLFAHLGPGRTVLLYPASSFARKVVHLLCAYHGHQHETLRDEAPFRSFFYSKHCVPQCCGTTVLLHRLRLTTAREPGKPLLFRDAAHAMADNKRKLARWRAPKCLDELPQLPRDVVVRVLQMLPLGDVRSCLLVCRHWSAVGRVSSLWRYHYFRITQPDVPQIAHHSSCSGGWRDALKDVVTSSMTARCTCYREVSHSHPT